MNKHMKRPFLTMAALVTGLTMTDITSAEAKAWNDDPNGIKVFILADNMTTLLRK